MVRKIIIHENVCISCGAIFKGRFEVHETPSDDYPNEKWFNEEPYYPHWHEIDVLCPKCKKGER